MYIAAKIEYLWEGFLSPVYSWNQVGEGAPGAAEKNPTNALLALVGEDHPSEDTIRVGLPPGSRSGHHRFGGPAV